MCVFQLKKTDEAQRDYSEAFEAEWRTSNESLVRAILDVLLGQMYPGSGEGSSLAIERVH